MYKFSILDILHQYMNEYINEYKFIMQIRHENFHGKFSLCAEDLIRSEVNMYVKLFTDYSEVSIGLVWFGFIHYSAFSAAKAM